MGDPYADKNGVLFNKLSCDDGEILKQQERIYTASRIIELSEKPIDGNFDLKHLQAIHQYVFQDVYSWAGDLRNVAISKGNTMFCPVENIVSYSQIVFDELKAEEWLRQENMCTFCKKGAYYFGEVNMIHPFREGNGRTQRLFFQQLADAAGYSLDFRKITTKQMLNAAIRSAKVDNNGFYEILANSIALKIKMSRSR